MRYTDPDWLRETYESHTLTEMAEMVGKSKATIIRWMDKHDIERREPGVQQAEGEYKDEEWLRREYIEKRRSTKEIADDFDVTKPTIKYWLEKHGIPIRSQSEAAKIRAEKYPDNLDGNRVTTIHANIFTHKDTGYERIQCGVEEVQVSHHRLIAALLVDDLSDLDGMHVHHTTEVPWLNYLDGLEVVTPKEHKARHA